MDPGHRRMANSQWFASPSLLQCAAHVRPPGAAQMLQTTAVYGPAGGGGGGGGGGLGLGMGGGAGGGAGLEGLGLRDPRAVQLAALSQLGQLGQLGQLELELMPPGGPTGAKGPGGFFFCWQAQMHTST